MHFGFRRHLWTKHNAKIYILVANGELEGVPENVASRERGNPTGYSVRTSCWLKKHTREGQYNRKMMACSCYVGHQKEVGRTHADLLEGPEGHRPLFSSPTSFFSSPSSSIMTPGQARPVLDGGCATLVASTDHHRRPKYFKKSYQWCGDNIPERAHTAKHCLKPAETIVTIAFQKSQP